MKLFVVAIAFLGSLHVTSAAAVATINKRFVAGKPASALADAGLLIHQFGPTDDAYPGPTMFKPCSVARGTCYFNIPGIGIFDDRVSCSITSAGAPKTDSVSPPPGTPNAPPVGGIGLYNYNKGGVILNPTAANMTCSFQGDGGTMTRVADARGGGCGCQNDSTRLPSNKTKCVEPQINATGGCDNSCPSPASAIPWLACHQCAWDADKLASMLMKQVQGAMVYNEVLLQAAPWRADPAGHIDAFFYPKGSDAASEAGVAKTQEAYAAFKQAFPTSDAPLLVLDATWPLHQVGDGPFSVAPKM
jgi:hypothetical protein